MLVNRRRFLTAACTSACVGGLWYGYRPPRESIECRFWLSDRAGPDRAVADRIAAYVERALEVAYREVDVSYGGVVAVEREDGYAVMTSGEWPRRVVGGHLTDTDVDPATDVNLLVTDGPIGRTPIGAGIPHLASVGGARYLGEAPARDEFDVVLPYANGTRAMQVLLHEVGHALGLEHEHGGIEARDGATVASPMVSAYAWADDPASRREFDADESACGRTYPGDRDGERSLSFEFSGCARSALREYSGGLQP